MKKRLWALLFSAAIAVSCFTACSSKADAGSSAAATAGTTASEAAQESKFVDIMYSKSFSIELLSDGIKKVTDGDGRELILVPKALGKIPAEYADSVVITTPVEHAVFLSSTQVGMLRAVDSDEIWDAVGGLSADSGWSSIEAIQSRLDSGKIIDIGNNSSNPDYEAIQALNPDVVFVYTGSNPQSDAIAKFEELGINYAVDNEYMESNYLARMEWMRFILTFYNADDAVDKVMKNAQDTTNQIKEQIADKEKPTVAPFSVSNGKVYCTIDSKWAGSMLEDMGGTNVFSGIESSPITMEELYERAQDADIIIYTSTPDMAAIIDAFPQIIDCKAYQNDKIYQYSDIFWMGIDKSDVMAADLAAVFYPDIFAGRTLNYYSKMAK